MDFTELERYIGKLTEIGYHGASIIVSKDGENVFSTAAGYKDSDCRVRASVNDIYWIFSCTKPLVCTAAMTLVEQGRLAMSDPVSKYIPEYGSLMVRCGDGSVRPAGTVMTIEHLFTMTGGLTYDFDTENVRAAMAREGSDTRSIVASFASDPLSFDPGTQFQYSLCHDVLGAVIEVVTGKSLSEYMDEVIFRPLHMNNTFFHPSREVLDNMALLYRFDNATFTSSCTSQINKYMLGDRYDSGGAGICSNASDYIEFLKVLSMNGTSREGYRLLKSETVASMGVNRLSHDVMQTFFTTRLYGYGWGYCGRCHVNPTASGSPSPVGEFGWDGAANDFALADPINHVAFFFSTGLLNCPYGYHIVHPELRRLVYKGLFA